MSNIENNQLLHSNGAINVTHKFYDKKFMLYVEGDDDIVFWDEHFRKYMSPELYEIEQVHGKENLDRYISGIKDNTLNNVVVACDSDFTFFAETNPLDNPLIVRTYGHSIENTMFCPCSVAAYIRRLSKTTADYLPEVIEWLRQFCSIAVEMLPYEIVNEINPRHCAELPKVFNKGFCYFQNAKAKTNLDKNKVNTYIQDIAQNYDEDKISKIKHQINEYPNEIRYLIQGHFIADAIMNYIRIRVKQIKGQAITLSNDAIYESVVDCKLSCSPLCKDKLFIKQQVERVCQYYMQHS